MSNELKVGSKIKSVSITLNVDMTTKDITKESLSVIGISDRFIVLDNQLFDKLANDNTFKECYPRFNKVSITESRTDFDIKYFGKFRISIYSTGSYKVIENKINREFNNWLDDKIGIYGCARRIHISLEKEANK